MTQSSPVRENVSSFLPVKIPRRIFESFDPAIQRFIQRRIEKGEAILEGDDNGD